MTFDAPRNGDVPQIRHTDPLPSLPPCPGRWREPYQDEDDGMWRARTVRPLSRWDEAAGLLDPVIAATREELTMLQCKQDELALNAAAVPLHRIPNTGPGS